MKFPKINNEEQEVVVIFFCQKVDLKILLTTFIDGIKAGSPTDSTVFWVSQKPREIAQKFNQKYEQVISNGSVKRLLKELGYGYRKQSKTLATGTYCNRNAQFEIITMLILAMSLQSPVISMDCKKKERLGNLYRDGKCYSQEPIKVFDHDYDHLSEGKVIPHGIYDLQFNQGYITLGKSAETAEFVTDNLLWWWTEYGIHLYPDTKNILLLCDAGGANSYRHHIFKNKLLELTKEIGISFIVAHYPPYSSKWNPIEHRLFCHVHHAMSGVVFSDYDIIKKRIESTTTKTGLMVFVRINEKMYLTGMRGNKEINTNTRIKNHIKIPELNYRIYP
jgi:hypothetical protein